MNLEELKVVVGEVLSPEASELIRKNLIAKSPKAINSIRGHIIAYKDQTGERVGINTVVEQINRYRAITELTEGVIKSLLSEAKTLELAKAG